MYSAVQKFVTGCPACQDAKTRRSAAPGPLHSLIPPNRAFATVGIDWILGLPQSGGYDALMVIICHFTKLVTIVPTTKAYDAQSSADNFFNNVVRKGWVPDKFVCNRDAKFMSRFRQRICFRLCTKQARSTAYHSQTNGATERTHQTIETALQAYTQAQGTEWLPHIPMVELAFNSTKSAATGFTPFELIYIQPLDIMQRLLNLAATSAPVAKEEITADAFVQKAIERLSVAREALQLSAALVKRNYDRRHTQRQPYAVGEFVALRLNDHPLSVLRRTKVNRRKLGPFQIVEVLANGQAVRLDLPSSIHIHPLVSVQYVERTTDPANDPSARRERELDVSILAQREKPTEPPNGSTESPKKGTMQYLVLDHPTGKEEWQDRLDVDPWTLADYEKRKATEFQYQRIPISSSLPAKAFRPTKTMERPVLYISRVTSEVESRYESTERELACLVWAFNRLRHYLEGAKVQIITDHQPIKGVLKSGPYTSYKSRVDRFRNLLMPCLDDIEVIYKPGTSHVNVDPLSRAEWQESTESQDSEVQQREDDLSFPEANRPHVPFSFLNPGAQKLQLSLSPRQPPYLPRQLPQSHKFLSLLSSVRLFLSFPPWHTTARTVIW